MSIFANYIFTFVILFICHNLLEFEFLKDASDSILVLLISISSLLLVCVFNLSFVQKESYKVKVKFKDE